MSDSNGASLFFVLFSSPLSAGICDCNETEEAFSFQTSLWFVSAREAAFTFVFASFTVDDVRLHLFV